MAVRIGGKVIPKPTPRPFPVDVPPAGDPIDVPFDDAPFDADTPVERDDAVAKTIKKSRAKKSAAATTAADPASPQATHGGFIVPAEKLQQAMSILGSIEISKIDETTNYLTIVSSPRGLWFTQSNTFCGTSWFIPCKPASVWKDVTLSSKAFGGIIRNCEGDVELVLDMAEAGPKVTIYSAGARWAMNGAVSAAPRKSPDRSVTLCKVDSQQIGDALAAASICTFDNANYPTAGVLIDLRPGEFSSVAALDGGRVIGIEIDAEFPGGRGNSGFREVLCPQAVRLWKSLPEGKATLHSAGGSIVAEIDGSVFWGNLLSGKFPNHDQFWRIPPTDKVAAVKAGDLIGAIRRAMATAEEALVDKQGNYEKTIKPVHFEMHVGLLKILGESSVGNTDVKLPVQGGGEYLRKFQAQWIINPVAKLFGSDEEVVMWLGKKTEDMLTIQSPDGKRAFSIMSMEDVE